MFALAFMLILFVYVWVGSLVMQSYHPSQKVNVQEILIQISKMRISEMGSLIVSAIVVSVSLCASNLIVARKLGQPTK
jgi:hypothetical protein